MSISLPSHSNYNGVANQFFHRRGNSESKSKESDDAPPDNLLNADEKSQRLERLVRQKRQFSISINQIPIIKPAPEIRVIPSTPGINTSIPWFPPNQNIATQIRVDLPRSEPRQERPDPSEQNRGTQEQARQQEHVRQQEQVRQQEEAHQQEQVRQQEEAHQREQARQQEIARQQEQARKQEQARQEKARQQAEEFREWERTWASNKEKVFLINGPQLREEAMRTGLTRSPGWPQWEREWQRQEEEWKNFVKSEWENLIREFQKRDREGISLNELNLGNLKRNITTDDMLAAENQLRQARWEALSRKLTQIHTQKVQVLQAGLIHEQIRIGKEADANEIREFEERWERQKETITPIANAVQLREGAIQKQWTTQPWWPQFESEWQQQELEWKNFLKTQDRNLLGEFHRRNEALRTHFPTVEELNTERQWRANRIAEVLEKSKQTQIQRIQTLQNRLNQFLAEEWVRLQNQQATQKIREFQESWRGLETITLANEIHLRANASRAGLTASPQWPRWEREWQEEERAWTNLIRAEGLNLIREFQKRDQDLTFATVDAVNAENQWRQTRVQETKNKLRQIYTEKRQSINTGLDRLVATEKLRIQNQEDGKIVQFFAEAATDTITAYLDTLTEEELGKEIDELKRIQQEGVRHVTGTTIISPNTLENSNTVNRAEEPEEGLRTRIWNATLGDTRLQGGFKMMGGVGEMVFGGILLVIPEPTMLTKVGGVALLGHGADVIAAGLRQLWSGAPVSSFTSQAVSSGLQAAGVNPVHANFAGELTEIGVAGVPIGIVGKVGAVGQSIKVLSNLRIGKWTAAEFQGIRIYQRNDLIDTRSIDKLGRTNLQRMQAGLAPIGPDGRPINLHHLLQSADSPLAEMTTTFHRQYSRTMHINPNTIPSGISRPEFDIFRINYWKKRADNLIP